MGYCWAISALVYWALRRKNTHNIYHDHYFLGLERNDAVPWDPMARPKVKQSTARTLSISITQQAVVTCLR